MLETKSWLKLGRWKQPTCNESSVASGIVGYGYSATNILPWYPKTYIIADHAQYVEEAEFNDQVKKLEKLFREKPKETSTLFKKVIRKNSERLLHFSPRTLTAQNISELFDMVSRQGRQWYEIMLADSALQIIYKNTLPKKFPVGNSEYTSETLLAKVALPKHLFPIIQERADLLKIACQILEGRDVKRNLKLHTRQYGWMNSLSWWDPPFTEAYYESEARKLAEKNPKRKLNDFLKARLNQRREMNKLLFAVKRKFTSAYLYIDIIRDLTDLKEENWDAVSIIGQKLRPKFCALAEKHGLSYNQLMMLAKDEWPFLLSGSLPVCVDKLNRRIQASLIIATMKERLIRSGSVVAEVLSVFEGKVMAVSSLKGMTVWPGKVTGKVRIMFSVDDVHSIQDGEVLVCPMTDPDYMPAIHKASAIVTDQGGVLCHAAIVARELQKPCIVGTKIATRTLKTGDLVEVDAEQGIVRKMS